jgi:SAM-dependent methyltransferase
VAPGIFSKIFGGSGRHGADDEFVPGEKISRRSTGFSEFIRAISREEGLKILDLGSTSPANITFMTGLGNKFHQEDVLRSASDKSLVISNGDGGTTIDVHRYFDENLDFEREEFDAVMFWDLADFLPEPLVKPLIERVHVAMKPGGILFALFHTKDAGPDAPFYRYNIAAKDTLELQPARAFRLQRIFNNRHVENLFREYSSIKFFLGRDNIREVLVIR